MTPARAGRFIVSTLAKLVGVLFVGAGGDFVLDRTPGFVSGRVEPRAEPLEAIGWKCGSILRGEVGGIVDAAGASVFGLLGIREDGAGTVDGSIWLASVGGDDLIGCSSGFDPLHDGREQIHVEGSVATAAVVAAREQIEARELFHALLAHGVLHGFVIGDRIQRGNMRVGPAVPDDELVVQSSKAREIWIGGVVEGMKAAAVAHVCGGKNEFAILGGRTR